MKVNLSLHLKMTSNCRERRKCATWEMEKIKKMNRRYSTLSYWASHLNSIKWWRNRERRMKMKKKQQIMTRYTKICDNPHVSQLKHFDSIACVNFCMHVNETMEFTWFNFFTPHFKFQIFTLWNAFLLSRFVAVRIFSMPISKIDREKMKIRGQKPMSR